MFLDRMKFFYSSLIFFSLLAFSTNKVTHSSDSTKKQNKEQEVELEEPQDFIPSLAESLSDTNRLKKEIKQQVSENMTKKGKTKSAEKKKAKRTLSRETAHFGDLDVNISERIEEDIIQPNLGKKKLKTKKK